MNATLESFEVEKKSKSRDVAKQISMSSVSTTEWSHTSSTYPPVRTMCRYSSEAMRCMNCTFASSKLTFLFQSLPPHLSFPHSQSALFLLNMSPTNATQAFLNLQTDLWGYNGHQYLRDIDVSEVSVYTGDNWKEWANSLTFAIGNYRGAESVLLKGLLRKCTLDDDVVRGLEHDLYDIIFRTISPDLTEAVREYIEVKSHRLERRASVIIVLLGHLEYSKLVGEEEQDRDCNREDIEEEHREEDEVEEPPQYEPTGCKKVRFTFDEKTCCSEQKVSETLQEYLERLQCFYIKIKNDHNVFYDCRHIMDNSLKGLRSECDRVVALELLVWYPNMSLVGLAEKVKENNYS
jgi:hypothetical protein